MLEQPIEQIYKGLGTSSSGLTTAEAERRFDEQLHVRHRSPLKKAVAEIRAFCSNPLVLILLAAAGVSASLGEKVDAAIIVAIVLVSSALNVLQTYRSGKAVDALRKMVAPTATVCRDGKWVSIPQGNIVPGDIIRLAAGALVPADARLIEAVDLNMQQAALTGESMPALKQVETGPLASVSPAETDACVFQGTSVLSGTGAAIVVAVGTDTIFGDIARRVAQRPPETEFERGLRHFGGLIMRTVILLVFFVFLSSVALRHNALESLLFSISLAVGLTPEFLPMITTITLGQGAVHMARKSVIVKSLTSIQNFGSMDVLCSDKTGTLTSGEMTLEKWIDGTGAESLETLRQAKLNSQLESGIQSTLETAILACKACETPPGEKVGEIPFDFDRRILSVATKLDGKTILIAKGAPESILARCASFPGTSQDVAENAEKQLGVQGFRVLGVASKDLGAQTNLSTADESGMTFTGFLAFADPPLADAGQLVSQLKEDGVQMKVISGDSDLVTRHVCESVGLDASNIAVGADLEHLTDPALEHVAETTNIFARISPALKNRIILALKRRGHVVGYMGDGINDAPSLHAADVGISVSSAVEVARDAAEIILLRPGLDVLHDGILEGRKAFGNVMKYLLMGTSSNFGNMFSMAGASVFLPFLPMLPTQILLNNFLYDLSQVTIPTDRVDDSYIRKPKKWDINLLKWFMIAIGPISSLFDFLTFYVLLHFLHAREREFHTGWFIESLATQVLVIFVIRTAGNPLLSRPSKALAATTLGITALAILIPYTPFAAPLGMVPLPLSFYGFLAVAVAVYLALVQAAKAALMKRFAL